MIQPGFTLQTRVQSKLIERSEAKWKATGRCTDTLEPVTHIGLTLSVASVM